MHKQITVYGASGRVGSIVVRRLVEDNYHVIAFVHGSPSIIASPKIKIVQGDIYDKKAVALALQGSDAVISTLGSWGTPKKDILQTGMRHIIPAMEKLKIKRIISLTGSEARDTTDKPRLMNQMSYFMLKSVAPKILMDGEEHIRLLRHSDLDWTVIRSPVMNELGSSGYILSDKLQAPWSSIHRHAVANAIVDQLSTSKNFLSSPIIVRE